MHDLTVHPSQSMALHYITSQYVTSHHGSLHLITLHTTPRTITLHYITLHYVILRYIRLHCTTHSEAGSPRAARSRRPCRRARSYSPVGPSRVWSRRCHVTHRNLLTVTQRNATHNATHCDVMWRNRMQRSCSPNKQSHTVLPQQTITHGAPPTITHGEGRGRR